MPDPLDILLDDLLPAKRAQLQDALRADPALGPWLQAVTRTMIALEDEWQRALPDRHVLVLYALERSGRASALTQQERELLDASRSELEMQQESIAASGDVVEQIRSDAEAFEAAWERQMTVARVREDRAALRRGSPSKVRWLWRVPVAAAVVMFIAVAVLIGRRGVDLEHVSTAAGETRLIEFADGSTIRLMGNSRLAYVPDGQESIVNRRAVLEGRAMFDLVPQRTGFIVETPTARATVLGTVFGVDASDEETSVTLVDGRVAVTNHERAEAAVVLDPGQQTRVGAAAMPTPPEAVDLNDALGWSGMFIFRATVLRDIATRLADHYGVRIAVHPTLEDEEITGTFSHEEEVETILRTIAQAVAAEVTVRSGEYGIMPR